MGTTIRVSAAAIGLLLSILVTGCGGGIEAPKGAANKGGSVGSISKGSACKGITSGSAIGSSEQYSVRQTLSTGVSGANFTSPARSR